jgi:hypothetical protein
MNIKAQILKSNSSIKKLLNILKNRLNPLYSSNFIYPQISANCIYKISPRL